MRKTLFILCLSISISALCQDTQQLRLMTYNLRFGELASLEELARYIKQHNPDIVAIQELDIKTNRSLAPHQNGKDFISELAYHTGLFGIFGKTINYRGGYYGIGILSKYPIIASERFMLPNPPPLTESRAILISQIELPNNKQVVFACTHLDLNAGKRVLQLQAINQKMSSYDGFKFIAGDFNTTPEQREICQELPKWTDALPSDPTSPAIEPKVKIDYILYENNPGIKIINSFVERDITISDHLPGIVDVKLSF